jgi:glutathione peroxidase
MKPVHFPFSLVILSGFLMLSTAKATADGAAHLLNHEVRQLGSEESVNLREAYGGKVVLIVNTASKCAFTDQYEGLETLYARYREQGLVVLGFPSNDFGNQEPGTEKQIKDFCRLTYSVRFPMFAKTSVAEGQAEPLFEGLAQAAGRYPQWNFHKYLIDRDGRLVKDYLSWTAPQSASVVEAIERLL